MLTDVAGIRVGHWTDAAAGTGCTAIILPQGARGGVDVRGGGPASRETDLLRPEATVPLVSAIVLSGGSAFGLDAASGVMAWCEEQGLGVDTGIATVPIVAAASLFDLGVYLTVVGATVIALTAIGQLGQRTRGGEGD